MILLQSKSTSQSVRGFLKKCKCRFRGESFEITDEALAFGLQMGWFEPFMGKYIFTDKGREEFLAFIKENRADFRS